MASVALRHPPFASDPLLASRDGRLLFSAQALDALTNGVAGVALPWLLLTRDGSTVEAGLVFTLTVLPYLLFGLIAGLVGDRMHRGRVIGATHVLQAVAAGLIPLSLLWGGPPLWLVLACAFLIGTGRVFSDAAIFGAVSSIIGREHFVRGQATLSVAWSAGFFVGPALAGFVIGAFGATAALSVEAVAFLVAALLVRAIRSSLDSAHEAVEEHPLEAIKAGLRFVLSDPVVRVFTLVTMLWNVTAAAGMSLQVPLLKNAIGLDADQTGLILGCTALMGIAAAPIISPLRLRLGSARFLLVAIAANGVVTVIAALAQGFWGGLIALCLMSLIDWGALAVIVGERQRRAPEALQARVGISGRMLGMTFLALGSVASSLLTEPLGVRGVFLVMGVLTCIIAMIAAKPLLRLAATLR